MTLTIIDCSRLPKKLHFLITWLIPCSLTTLMGWGHSSSLLDHLQLYHGCQFTMVTAWQMQGTRPKESQINNTSQIFLAEHRCSTNWEDWKSTQIKPNQIKCWFLRRGENQSTRRKTSRSRVENQQTQPTCDAESGNRTRNTLVEGECSHHCANPAPLSKYYQLMYIWLFPMSSIKVDWILLSTCHWLLSFE